jgi:hypothetical protein
MLAAIIGAIKALAIKGLPLILSGLKLAAKPLGKLTAKGVGLAFKIGSKAGKAVDIVVSKIPVLATHKVLSAVAPKLVRTGIAIGTARAVNYATDKIQQPALRTVVKTGVAPFVTAFQIGII